MNEYDSETYDMGWFNLRVRILQWFHRRTCRHPTNAIRESRQSRHKRIDGTWVEVESVTVLACSHCGTSWSLFI